MGCEKIRAGKYWYKGFYIIRHGYHQPSQRVVWEGVDCETGDAEVHAYTKRDVIYHIDRIIERRCGDEDK